MDVNNETIVVGADALEKMSHLGVGGVILWGLLLFSAVFGFLIWALWKLTSNNHQENIERIEYLEETKKQSVEAEKRCLARVEAVTDKLEKCTDTLIALKPIGMNGG